MATASTGYWPEALSADEREREREKRGLTRGDRLAVAAGLAYTVVSRTRADSATELPTVPRLVLSVTAAGQPIRYLGPDKGAAYIEANGLYGASAVPEKAPA